MPAETTQLEIANLNDWLANSTAKVLIMRKGWPTSLQGVQPAEVMLTSRPTAVKSRRLPRAKIAVGGVAVVQGDIDGICCSISCGAAWSAAMPYVRQIKANPHAGVGSSPVTGNIAMTASPTYWENIASTR